MDLHVTKCRLLQYAAIKEEIESSIAEAMPEAVQDCFDNDIFDIDRIKFLSAKGYEMELLSTLSRNYEFTEDMPGFIKRTVSRMSKFVFGGAGEYF